MAKPQPSESSSFPPNKNVDLITRFRADYANVLNVADVGVAHTATDGWRQLYADTRKTHADVSRDVAKQMRQLADTIESVGSSEDLEKEIADCKKRSEQNRKDREAFNRQVVEPVKAPVLEAAAVIEKYRSQAARDEQDTPLVNIGLIHLMRDAISESPKVTWDEETGQIAVVTSAKA